MSRTITRRRRATTALGAVAVASAVALSGCSSSKPENRPTITPATPAAVALASVPAGQVVPAPASKAIAFDTEHRILAMASNSDIVLFAVDGGLRQVATVPLGQGAPAHRIVPGAPGHLLVAARDAVLDVDTQTRTARPFTVDGDVLDVTRLADGRIVAGLADGRILVLDTDGGVQKTISGLVEASRILTHAGHVLAADRKQASLTEVDLDKGVLGQSLRVGRGITEAEVDTFGRVVAVDTGKGQIIGYTMAPFMERFLYPVPDSPFAVDYDDVAKLTWVSVTGTNQVVGYALSSGIPVEKQRKATVAQPDAIAVDPRDGTVFVVSASGGGVQAIPTR